MLYYFSKEDSESLDILLRAFGGGSLVHFIENEDTHQWLTKTHTWTRNPHWALKFPNHMKAQAYGNANGISNFFITEHEFVSSYDES